MRNHKLRQAGFTLIELLLYVALVSVILFASTMTATLAIEARVKSQTVMLVEQQGSAAMSYITGTLRNATSTALANGASASSITLVMANATLNPTVINLSGTTLQTREGVATAVALNGGQVQASSLTFTNLTVGGSTQSIRVSFTLTRTNPNNQNRYDYSKTFVSTATIRI